MVRCPVHGRVYDSDKDEACPLCLQGVPGAGAVKTPKSPEQAAAEQRKFLLTVALVLVLVLAVVALFLSLHQTPEDRAMARRDSLRAIAGGPARPDTMTFARANDLSPIRHARTLRASLLGVLGGRGGLMAFAEGLVDTLAAERAEQRRAKAYLAFAKRWHDRLDAVTKNGTDFRYAPGVQYGPQMETVTNQLEAALSVMRDMVRRDAVKSLSERRADARAAAGYLNAAGTVLTNLPR
jgi:hypothetical protein